MLGGGLLARVALLLLEGFGGEAGVARADLRHHLVVRYPVGI